MSTAGNRRRLRRGALIALATAAAGGSLVAVNAIANAGTEPEAAPEAVVLGTADPDAIDGEYLVVLEDRPAPGLGALVDDVVEPLADQVGVDIDVVDELDLIGGFVAEMSPAEARRLAADDAVDFVEQNRAVSIADVQADPPSWGLDRIDQTDLPLDAAYEYGPTGEGTTAYILDTGIALDHEEFAGRLGEGFDAVDSGGDGDDCHGHGTHVAGTVGGATYGVAKAATLVPVRVLDCSGGGTYAGLIAGIDWVVADAEGPSVANLSLGGPASAALNDAVAEATAAGVTFAVASGNEGADACGVSPASEASAITVGATDRWDGAAAWSNWGECVDVLAPGDGIASAWIGGADASRTLSGTSMATPHVAGAVALLLETDPGASPEAVSEALLANATAGVVSEANGSPNLLLNTEFLLTD